MAACIAALFLGGWLAIVADVRPRPVPTVVQELEHEGRSYLLWSDGQITPRSIVFSLRGLFMPADDAYDEYEYYDDGDDEYDDDAVDNAFDYDEDDYDEDDDWDEDDDEYDCDEDEDEDYEDDWEYDDEDDLS